MDHIELTADFFEAIEKKKWFKLEQMTDDNFRYYSFLPDPFDKKTWLAYEEAIMEAFPDWSYNVQNIQNKGNIAQVTIKISGTHLHALKLPWKELKPILPTKKHIEMPEEHASVKFRENKISEFRVETKLHGNLPGLLEQLGVY